MVKVLKKSVHLLYNNIKRGVYNEISSRKKFNN